MGTPSVYPMGTIIYKPEKCFNGFTLFQANERGAVIIDMNGTTMNCWEGLHGFPNKLLPEGQIMGSRGQRDTKFSDQDMKDLVQVDWDGNIIWEWKQKEFITDPGFEGEWMARQHHDYQREGNPVGYYTPELEPKTTSGNTLILIHEDVKDSKISLHELEDDSIIEVDWNGNIVWEWRCHEHFDEFGFNNIQKNALARDPGLCSNGKGDWMHINSMSLLGPNKWYEAGDQRFHPDNIIISGRQTNIVAIIEKKSGKIVWQLGPNYSEGAAKEIGQIIGQHHAHMIPKGLPGEGNILIFDNGGFAGYTAPNESTETGKNGIVRSYSRVLEIDPTAMKIVWQCRPMDLGYLQPMTSDHFFSCYISSAQRLPNGNTLIAEGEDGRLIEITPEYEIVWEYICPYFGEKFNTNMVYRAYRYPYNYIPQLKQPKEVAIEPIDNIDYRLPGAKGKEFRRLVRVEGVENYREVNSFCLQIEKD